MTGPKVVYVCLPYRYRRDIMTMVYAGTENLSSDGDILRVEYDQGGRPFKFSLIHEEDQDDDRG